MPAEPGPLAHSSAATLAWVGDEWITVVAPSFEAADALVQRTATHAGARAVRRGDGRWDVILSEDALLDCHAERHANAAATLDDVRAWVDELGGPATVSVLGRQHSLEPRRDGVR